MSYLTKGPQFEKQLNIISFGFVCFLEFFPLIVDSRLRGNGAREKGMTLDRLPVSNRVSRVVAYLRVHYQLSQGQTY